MKLKLKRKKNAVPLSSALWGIGDSFICEMESALPILGMQFAGVLNHIEEFHMSFGDGIPISPEEVSLILLEPREWACQ